jgi:hypothetical protein
LNVIVKLDKRDLQTLVDEGHDNPFASKHMNEKGGQFIFDFDAYQKEQA